MRDLKILTGLVYVCVAGVVVSLGGGIYTAVRQHQEASRPHPSVFPTPAALPQTGGNPASAPLAPGALPTPAQ